METREKRVQAWNTADRPDHPAASPLELDKSIDLA
jgi:hypothetical protein